MNDKVFGALSFNFGWRRSDSIFLWGKDHEILGVATAYYESESITEEQQKAYSCLTFRFE